MKEFSKRVILMLTGAWFLCAVLGIAVVAVQLVRGRLWHKPVGSSAVRRRADDRRHRQLYAEERL